MLDLVLFDVSPVLYAGSAYGTTLDIVDQYNPHNADLSLGSAKGDAKEVKGLNVGGIRTLMTRVSAVMKENRTPVLVMDSKNAKREMYPGYQVGRKFNPDTAIQNAILKDIIPRTGLNYAYKEGYEADEIIYSIVQAQISNASHISIVTGDRDLAGCLIQPKVDIIGASSRDPYIDSSIYAEVVRSHEIVPYNCMLPYIVLFGKHSNSIYPFSDKKTNLKLLIEYMEFCDNNKFPEGSRSQKAVFAAWLISKRESGTVSADELNELILRMNMVFPRILPAEDQSIQICEMALNKAILSEFFGMLKLYSVARCWGVETSDVLSKHQWEYLNGWSMAFNSGTFAVDNHEELNTQLFEPDEDIEEEGVGGF